MAWGLEARVPFLDKKFLEVAMNVDAKYKMFSKGAEQQTDAEGRPIMEKVSSEPCLILIAADSSTLSERRSTAHQTARRTSRTRSCGDRRSSSRTVSDTRGSTA